MPSIFGKLNVQTFCIFCVVIVSCAIKFDIHEVVSKRVEFREVHLSMDTKVYEDILVVMEVPESFLQLSQCFGCVERILGQIYKIQ
jgi:hypothetical protein